MKRASLNHTYRLVWSERLQAFVAVAEIARARGKRSSRAFALSAALWIGAAHAAEPGALPTGGQIVAGAGQINQTGKQMTITQSSDRLIANWSTFNIGADASVNFAQPNASSIALNRILDANPSQIFGSLSANGRVFLLNPNGILFGASAQVNVGGLVASSLDLSNDDFLAGRYAFKNAGHAGRIENQGALNASHGVVALIAPQVSNSGSITANGGSVALAAGDKVGLDFHGDGLVTVNVDQGTYHALAENKGLIQADGGVVTMTAKSANTLLETVVNNEGVIQARTLAEKSGRILLLGDMEHGRVHVGGTLDASAPTGGDGGFGETSAADVAIASNSLVTTLAAQGKTGDWLIDPNDYTIAASGGNITGAALASSLNSTNVTIQTTTQGTAGGNGDIFINDAITKTGSGATTLTLQAERNIEVNQAVTSSSGRLNVVLTPDSDANSSGDVIFGSSGRVVTNNGNFYVGSVSGVYDSVTARGQNFTMASGSYINVGQGNLDISVNGNVSLPDNSAQSTTYALSSTYATQAHFLNNGSQYYTYQSPFQYFRVSGLTIATANTNASVADILTSVDTTLSAGTIGSSGTPIKLSGPSGLNTGSQNFPAYARTLTIANSSGSSYANEIGNQIFGTINVNIGSQTNATQNIQIMGDAGGDGTSGTGHILMNTNGSGVLALATGDIKTFGIAGNYNSGTPSSSTDPSVFPTSVGISASNITFADNSVNTGGSTFYWLYPNNHAYYPYYTAASFSATAFNTMQSSSNNSTGDINGQTVSLTAPTLGTSSNPVEVASGSTLSLYNTGGSTYVKSVDNSFGQINLTNVKASGTHSILFSGGDHIEYATDGNGIIVPTLGARTDGTTFGATSGIDTTGSNRSVTLTANSGYIEYDTNSVNLGNGTLSTSISSGNSDRNAGKAIYAKNAKDGNAEITAGSLNFTVNSTTAGAISGLEIAKGGTSTNNALTVTSYGGNIDITELTANDFKSLTFNLYGSNVAQNVAVDLAGADDVNFSDSGSLITLDATKVGLSANNRNFTLYSTSRNVQIDSVSLGTGNYSVYASGLKLNGDVITDGGTINLYGYGGVTLMKSLRIDSNADDVSNSTSSGSAGSITVYGTMSSQAPGYALTVDSASSTTSGGSIQFYSNIGNSAGAYLSGLTLTSKGSTNTNDGALYVYGTSYLLNGNFSATGNTFLYGSTTTIDTEQGNTASAGNISFAGYNLTGISSYNYNFNTATTAAGMSGGNVNLFDTYQHGTFSSARVNITTTGGTGGTAGNITLPAMSATTNGYDNSQTYTGGIITLNGDINTERSNVTMAGDVRLASNVTIKTWQSAAANITQNGTAGAVSITGTGVSATGANKSLTINTGTNTGNGYFNPPTNTQTWTHNGGAVSIKTGNAGGYYVDSLTVNTSATGTYNAGTAGAITLNGINTTGNQIYTGGAATVTSDLISNGGNINLSGVSSLALSGGPISIKTDMAGGTNAAGTLNIGSFNLNGAVALTIDTTADGGGAGTDLTLPSVGNNTALTSLDAKARTLTVGGNINASSDVTLRATNAILLGTDATINTSASNGNIALNSAVDSTGASRALTLNAGTGTATLGGAVGANLSLSALAVTGSTLAINGGAVTTSGAQTYNGSTTLGADTTLTTTNSAVIFNGTLNSSGTDRSLTTSTGSGVTTFSNQVGGVLSLASLSTDRAAINTASVTTSGAQTYNGAVTLGFDDGSGAPYLTTLTTSNGNVTFAGTLNDTATYKHALQIDAGSGTVTFAGTVGGSIEPFGLYVNGPTTLAANMTLGRAEFFSPVTLGADVTLTQTCCYGVHFHDTVDGAYAFALAVGSVSFDGAVGGTSALTRLSVSGDIYLNGNVTTVGTQTYDGNVTLLATNTTLSQTGANTDFTLQANRSIVNGSGVDAGLTIKSARDIVLAGGSSIGSNGGKLDVTLNARAADGASGAIIFNDGAGGGAGTPVSITSNGGNINLVGGSNGTDYAIGGANAYTYGADSHQNGASLAYVTLDSRVYSGGVPQSSGGGDITIKAKGYAGNITMHGGGIWAGNSSILTGGGHFTLDAWAQRSGNPTTGGIRYGAFLDTLTLTTDGGAVSITTPAPSADTGLYFSNISPRSVSAGNGDITITTDTISLADNESFQSTGALWIQPYTAGTTIGVAGGSGTLSLSANNLSNNFVNGFSRITIGNGSAGALTVGGTTTLNDDAVLVSGGNINIDADVDASGHTLSLTGGSGATVSGNGNITAAGLLLDGTNASYALNTAAGNHVGTLAATNTAAVNFTNSGSFVVGTVTNVDGVSSSGAITLEANGATADLTLDKPVVSTNGDIVLAAGRHFINNNAVNAGIDAGSGRYFVYSTNPIDTTEEMTGYSKHYDQTYSPGSTPAYASNGNWFFYSVAPVLTVTPDGATVTYGNTPAFTTAVTGFIDGDTLASAGVSGTATFAIGGSVSGAGYATAGSHDVSYASGLASSLGYAFRDNAASSNELTVNRAQIQVTSIVANDRSYDATTHATLSGTATVATLAGDAVEVAGPGVGTFADKNVGTGKQVTVTGYTLTGADAANYEVTQPTGLSADVTPALLTISDITLASKAYDSNTTATVSSYGVLQGVLVGDAVALDATAAHAAYNDAQIGNGKLVTITGLALTGTDAANYVLSAATGTADISSNSNASVNAVTTSVSNAGANLNSDAQMTVSSESSGASPQIRAGAGVEALGNVANRTLIVDMTGVTGSVGPLTPVPTFTETTSSLTLSLNHAGALDTPQTAVLPIYHQDGNSIALQARVTAVDQGNNLTLMPAAAGATQPLSMGSVSAAQSTVVRLPDGTEQSLTIAMTDTGVLVIGVPSTDAQAFDTREEKLIALAIAYAKEHLGVSVEALTGVVISRSM